MVMTHLVGCYLNQWAYDEETEVAMAVVYLVVVSVVVRTFDQIE